MKATTLLPGQIYVFSYTEGPNSFILGLKYLGHGSFNITGRINTYAKTQMGVDKALCQVFQSSINDIAEHWDGLGSETFSEYQRVNNKLTDIKTAYKERFGKEWQTNR